MNEVLLKRRRRNQRSKARHFLGTDRMNPEMARAAFPNVGKWLEETVFMVRRERKDFAIEPATDR